MHKSWIASWTAAPMNVWGPDAPLSGFFAQTVREVARLSLGGDAIVVRLTNEHGSTPLRLDHVTIGRAGEQGALEPLTVQPVTFGGSPKVTIYPGTAVMSDPVSITVGPLSRLSVSYFSSGFIPVDTYHFEAQQTAYVSEPGDFTSSGEMIVQQVSTSHFLLSGLYVLASEAARGVVCFGDSITDGYGSTVDADRRWPDVLAERLVAQPLDHPVAVLNQGIGGNRLLNSRRGILALARLDRDVFSLAGLTHLVLLEGINDIVWPNTVLAGPQELVSAKDICEGLRQIIVHAKMRGLRVILGTLLPFEGTLPEFPNGGYYTPEKERIRQTVNAFIRTESEADHVADFDTLLCDPRHPARLNPQYDSGDHIHPNDAGYRAMAELIDLNWLRLTT